VDGRTADDHWRASSCPSSAGAGGLRYTFLFQWNKSPGPDLLNSVENYTVPLALNFFRGERKTDRALLMAGSAIAIVPVMIFWHHRPAPSSRARYRPA